MLQNTQNTCRRLTAFLAMRKEGGSGASERKSATDVPTLASSFVCKHNSCKSKQHDDRKPSQLCIRTQVTISVDRQLNKVIPLAMRQRQSNSAETTGHDNGILQC